MLYGLKSLTFLYVTSIFSSQSDGFLLPELPRTKTTNQELKFPIQKVTDIFKGGDRNFQGEREGERGRRGWYLGVEESKGHAPKSCNLKIGTLIKTVAPEILAMSQSRNYSEVPVYIGNL